MLKDINEIKSILYTFIDLNKIDRKINLHSFAGIAQLVERNLAKVEVAGSSPVSRSCYYWMYFLIINQQSCS